MEIDCLEGWSIHGIFGGIPLTPKQTYFGFQFKHKRVIWADHTPYLAISTGHIRLLSNL